MLATHLAGRGAAARKYDLLTALSVSALSGTQHYRVSVLRLIALITARYNWRLDEVSVGHEELARLWDVNPRTVKREVARLKALGLIRVKRAGVRGRVSAYALDHGTIARLTAHQWDRVNADYADRMADTGAPEPDAPANVVPFPEPETEANGAPSQPARDCVWAQAQGLLARQDAALCKAWFAPMTREALSAERLTLRAPSRFHATYVRTHLLDRLEGAVGAVAPGLTGVTVLAAGPDLR